MYGDFTASAFRTGAFRCGFSTPCRQQMVDVGQQLQSKCRLFFFYFHILSCHKQMASRGGMERMGKETHEGEGATPGHISPGLPITNLYPAYTHNPPLHAKTLEAKMSCVGPSWTKFSPLSCRVFLFKDTAQVFFWWEIMFYFELTKMSTIPVLR